MSAPSRPPVEVCLLGPPRWSVAGLRDAPLSRKDAALLALLALGGEQARDRVARWLWPDVDQAGANLNLRQRLFKLRKISGHRLIDSGATLRLLPGIRLDVLDPDCADDGELLGGHDYGGRSSLDSWVRSMRERFDRLRIDRLMAQAGPLQDPGALAAAFETCQRILARAPLDEHAWRGVMRLHHLRGDRAAAVAAFERLEQRLHDEQGSRPSPETTELLAVLKAGPARDPAAGPPLPASLLVPPVLVGRRAALHAMAHAWRAGRAVLLLGAGGIGKSRTLTEFTRDCGVLLSARARPGDAGMPYATAASLLQQGIDRCQPELSAPTRSELARLLPALGDAPPHEAQQERLWRAVESALASCLARGLEAVAVDDLHFADPATVELLRWLLASPALARLRWCFGSRPDEPGPAAPLLRDWLGDSNRVEPITLQALSSAEVRQFVESLRLGPALGSAADLADGLVRHVGGHPLYMLEALKHLVQTGGGVDDWPRSATALALIGQRFERLSAQARELMSAFAIAGPEPGLGVVARALNRPLLELAPAWAELEAAQVVHGSSFTHDLVRECALARIPQALRLALHAELARALSAQPDAEPAQLAHHWWAAERWQEAAPHLVQAARAARRSGRLAEAQALFEQAAESSERAGDPEGRFAALAEAVSALMLRQGSPAALQRLQQIEALANTAGRRVRWLVLSSEALLNLARFAEALHATTEAMRLAELGTAVQADASSLHGRALALNGRAAEAISLLEAASTRAAEHADLARQLVIDGALAHAQFLAGHRAAALRVQQRALQHAQALADAAEVAHSTANLATLATQVGDAALALRAAREADQRLDAIGADGNQRAFNRLILARCAAHFGHFDESRRALAPLLEAGIDAGETTAAQTRVAWGILLLWLGRPADALQAVPDRVSRVHPLGQAGALLLRLRALDALGSDLSAATRELTEFGRLHPDLLDEPTLAMEWSRFVPAVDAVDWLRRLRNRMLNTGAAGVARSLALREVQCLVEFDPAAAASQAASLTGQIDAGLSATTYPPEAWWVLAEALRIADPAAAAACLARAGQWIARAELPEPLPRSRSDFEMGNPLNRRVLMALSITRE